MLNQQQIDFIQLHNYTIGNKFTGVVEYGEVEVGALQAGYDLTDQEYTNLESEVMGDIYYTLISYEQNQPKVLINYMTEKEFIKALDKLMTESVNEIDN